MGYRCEDARDSRLIEPTGSGQLSPILEKPGAARLLVAGGRIGQEHTAGYPDRYTPFTAHLVSPLALPDRLQSLR